MTVRSQVCHFHPVFFPFLIYEIDGCQIDLLLRHPFQLPTHNHTHTHKHTMAPLNISRTFSSIISIQVQGPIQQQQAVTSAHLEGSKNTKADNKKEKGRPSPARERPTPSDISLSRLCTCTSRTARLPITNDKGYDDALCDQRQPEPFQRPMSLNSPKTTKQCCAIGFP